MLDVALGSFSRVSYTEQVWSRPNTKTWRPYSCAVFPERFSKNPLVIKG